jgi:uncharacterized membrane protein/glutaredoxin
MRSCSSSRLIRQLAQYAALSLLMLAMFASPASAQTAEPPLVKAVLFTSPVCTFCRQIVERDLPPAIQKFGQQLQIIHVDVNTPAGEQLCEAALKVFNLPRGIPLLFIGQTTLGGVNITPQLSDLVEGYLAQRGMDWPAIPGLEEYLAAVQATVTGVALPTNAIVDPTFQPAKTGPVVYTVMFWMDGCPRCEEVLQGVLPPLQAQYGSQLEILLVEVHSTVDVNALYETASRYHIPQQQVGVPFLIIGEHTVVGSDEVAWQFPGLIESYLADGGVSLPEIPELEAFSSQVWFSSVMQDLSVEEDANVHILLFSTSDCNACQLITDQTQELVSESYSEQVTVEMIDVVTGEDVEHLYQVAAKFGISKDQVDLPLVIIGDQVLIGEDIPEKLPALVETYLQLGGVERPDISTKRSDGFTLAIVIMAVMSVALLYSLVAFAMGKTLSLPTWADWLIPALIILGIGVAGYLSYVETQSVEAVCGPVGDCNTVQQSRYATLFGFLPVGVLGLLGYLGMLAAWLTRKYLPNLAKLADLAFFAMAVVAVLFSLYLTYLEPFIIRAVCIWCLSSAVIVTLLLLLGTPPAILQFSMVDKDD